MLFTNPFEYLERCLYFFKETDFWKRPNPLMIDTLLYRTLLDNSVGVRHCLSHMVY